MKPLGVWGIDDVPPWAHFATMNANASDAQLAQAKALQARGGRVLMVMYLSPLEPAGYALAATRARFERAGLRPDGIMFGEEWYNPVHLNAFPGQGMEQIRACHAYVSAQHATIKTEWPGIPIVYLEGFVNDVPIFGPAWYRPVPAHTDILAIEAYVPASHTWDAAQMDQKLAYACGTPFTYYDPELRRTVTSQRTEPVALVTQAFRAEPDWSWPTDETIIRTIPWLQHPRVMWHWPFTFPSRSATFQSWMDWDQKWKLGQAWGLPT